MQTRQALHLFSNGATDPEALGPLAEHGERLLAAFEQREAARMAEADERAQYQGMEAPLAALRRLVGELAGESIVNNRIPCIATYDAYCIMADAAKDNPQDRGLREASLFLGNASNHEFV